MSKTFESMVSDTQTIEMCNKSFQELIDESDPVIDVRFAFSLKANDWSRLRSMSNKEKQDFALKLLGTVVQAAFNSEGGRDALREIISFFGEEIRSHPVIISRATEVFVILKQDRFMVWLTQGTSLDPRRQNQSRPWSGVLIEARCDDSVTLEQWSRPFIERVEKDGLQNEGAIARKRGDVWMK